MFTTIDKFLVGFAAAAGEAITAGLVNGTAAHWLQIIIAGIGAAGVYLVPNKPAPATKV